MAELFFAAEALEAANRADDMWNCLLEAHSVHPLLTLRQRELFSSAAHLKACDTVCLPLAFRALFPRSVSSRFNLFELPFGRFP